MWVKSLEISRVQERSKGVAQNTLSKAMFSQGQHGVGFKELYWMKDICEAIYRTAVKAMSVSREVDCISVFIFMSTFPANYVFISNITSLLSALLAMIIYHLSKCQWYTVQIGSDLMSLWGQCLEERFSQPFNFSSGFQPSCENCWLWIMDKTAESLCSINDTWGISSSGNQECHKNKL